MLSRTAEQLKKFGHTDEAGALFDQVIFCANVTYADGGFKGGAYGASGYCVLRLTCVALRSHHTRNPRS